MNSPLGDQSPELSKDNSEQPRRLSIGELASFIHEDITKAGSYVLELLTTPDAVSEEELKEAWINYANLTTNYYSGIGVTTASPTTVITALAVALLAPVVSLTV